MSTPTPIEPAAQRVDMPHDILVACPKAAATIRAHNCEQCEHCAGLTEDRFPGAAGVPFEARHMVACRFPISRPLQRFSEDAPRPGAGQGGEG